MHGFVFSLRDKLRNEKDFYIYKEFRKSYGDLWDKLFDEFFKNVGLYPLYELAITLVARLKILENFENQQGFVMKFLEVIKGQEEDSTDITSFLKKFESLENEDLYVTVSGSDSIRIQTIHKSKGLEFPVVILPSLGMDIHVGSGGNLGQQSFIEDVKEDEIELLRIKSKYLMFSTKLEEIRHREYIKSFVSELNNIYVALTRASEEMHVFVPKKTGNSFNFVNFLVPEENFEMGSPQDKKKKTQRDKQSGNEILLPASDYYDWIEFLKDEFSGIGNIVNRAKIQRGNIVHFMMSTIGNMHDKDVDYLVANAVESARSQFSLVHDFEEYEKIVRNLVTSADFERFFVVKEGNVSQEVEVVNGKGHTKRIDRLMVNKKDVSIVDYKSSRDSDGKYAEQVEEYKEIMKDIYPGKEIKGYLIYLDEMVCEEV